jgi:hypothetical protein
MKSADIPWLLSGLLLACSLFTPAWAGEAGVIKNAQGSVTVKRGAVSLKAASGMVVQTADQIVTGEKSAVGITLRDNTVLTAGPNANLALDRFSFDPQTQKGELGASVKRGSLAVISGKIAKASPDNVQFKTPTVTLGVRGTEFIIDVADRGG